MSITIANLHEDIYARTQIPELFEDLCTEISWMDTCYLAQCGKNIQQVLWLVSDNSWRSIVKNDGNVDEEEKIEVLRNADIIVGFYLPIDKLSVKFTFSLVSIGLVSKQGPYTQTITLVPGQIYYTIENKYPYYAIAGQFTKMYIKMLEGNLNDINLIHSYTFEGSDINIRKRLASISHEFQLADNKYLRIIKGEIDFGTKEYRKCPVFETLIEISMFEKINYADFNVNKYKDTNILKYNALLENKKARDKKYIEGLSQFDINYITRGECTSLVASNNLDDFTINLKKGDNQFNLLRMASVKGFKNIIATKTPGLFDKFISMLSVKNQKMTFTLNKYSNDNNDDESRETYTTDDLLSCRAMFIAYLDCLTNLTINTPCDCTVKFEFF